MTANNIEKILNKKFGTRFKKGVEFKSVTTFGIGGKIRYFVEAVNAGEVVFLIRFCRAKNIVFFVLGGGSNVLAGDGGFNGLVISTLKMNRIKFKTGNFFKNSKQDRLLTDKVKVAQSQNIKDIQNKQIKGIQSRIAECQCGVRLSALVVAGENRELGGLEWSVGIPGTVGGATLMNAGAFGGQLSDRIVSVVYFDGKKIKKSWKKDLIFEYRFSSFKKIKDVVILTVCFQLESREKEEIRKNIRNITEKRLATQKVGYPSAGSVFKRLPHITAAEMIDQAGLKGTQIGGAMVSKVHSGYIVNVGGATCRDVIKLIDFISKSVYNKFTEKLELEIILIGEEDEQL